jgi:hypothetical protein
MLNPDAFNPLHYYHHHHNSNMNNNTIILLILTSILVMYLSHLWGCVPSYPLALHVMTEGMIKRTITHCSLSCSWSIALFRVSSMRTTEKAIINFTIMITNYPGNCLEELQKSRTALFKVASIVLNETQSQF